MCWSPKGLLSCSPSFPPPLGKREIQGLLNMICWLIALWHTESTRAGIDSYSPKMAAVRFSHFSSLKEMLLVFVRAKFLTLQLSPPTHAFRGTNQMITHSASSYSHDHKGSFPVAVTMEIAASSSVVPRYLAVFLSTRRNHLLHHEVPSILHDSQPPPRGLPKKHLA